MENVVVIGTGDLYQRFLAFALEDLRSEGRIEILRTIDIIPRKEEQSLSNVEHKIRLPSQKLSEILIDIKDKDPIIILGHSNHLHVSDAEDLVLNGFKVMIEKPYAIDFEQLNSLKTLILQNPGKIFLLDYYLKRKATPLFLLSGLIKNNTFYTDTEKVVRKKENLQSEFIGKGLTELIGDPVSVKVMVLEGSSITGKLDNRGPHLFKINTGGGMIQDLGLHSAIMLFSVQDYIGDLDISFNQGNVRSAQCNEYINLADKIHKVPEEEVAESYAEIVIKTSKQIPVEIYVGKYIEDRVDQKKILIHGTKGKIIMDFHTNILEFYQYGQLKDKIELINTKKERYYPVIRSGLEFFNGKEIFNKNILEIMFNSQEFILNVLKKASEKHAIKLYDQGKKYSDIFKEEKLGYEKLSKLNNSSLKDFYKGYSSYLTNILESLDLKDLDNIANTFLEARKNGNTIYFIGNGGSASTASHFSQDLAEVGRKVGVKLFKSVSLTDNMSAITASANDHGYDKVFSFQMQGTFKKNDVLVAISASGNSPNVLEAVKFAKEKGGTVIGLIGFDGGKLKEISDYVFHAQADKGEYGPVEDLHMIFDHLITSYFYYKLKEEINKDIL